MRIIEVNIILKAHLNFNYELRTISQKTHLGPSAASVKMNGIDVDMTHSTVTLG
jgi:hypothetical protein